MAHKQFYVTDAGASFYRTRRLSAGDPITLSSPEARLQLALGHVAGNPPRRPATKPVIPTVDEVLGAEVVEPAPKKAPAKRAPRKKAAAKK